MATAPTSIKAYVLPTKVDDDPYLEDLKMIETPNLKLNYPDTLKPENQAKLKELKEEAAATHLVYDLPEGTQRGIREGVCKGRYQSNIRLLPDTRTHWGDEGWSKRAAINLSGYHVFYSLRREGQLNDYAGRKVSGKMFLLELSDNVDGEERFYVDFNPNPNADEDNVLKEIFGELPDQYYYGSLELQTDILAYKLHQDATVPTKQYIDTIEDPCGSSLSGPPPTDYSPSQQAGWEERKARHKGFHYIWCRGERTSQSEIELLKLPRVQPGRPKQWDDRAWKNRIAVGDAEWHMFLTLAKGGNLSPNTNTSKTFPLCSDVYILKVSGDLDSKEEWFYEDVDSDGELSSGELNNLMKKLVGILKEVKDAGIK